MHAAKCPTGGGGRAARGGPGAGRPHASTSPTGGSPATPLRLGRHEGGPDEQDTAPDQADGDVAALATCMRCDGARRRPPVGRAVGRAVGEVVGWMIGGGVGEQASDPGSLPPDLHDDRPALSVRELVTDEDLAVLVLVDGFAADLRSGSCPP